MNHLAKSAGAIAIAVLLLSIPARLQAQANPENGQKDKSTQAQIEALKKQIKALQMRLDRQEARSGGDAVDLSDEDAVDLSGGDAVDLTGADADDLSGAGSVTAGNAAATHVLARPWYDNIRISGFGTAGFLDSGESGIRPNGGFVIKESSLFVEAEAWENVSMFLEMHTNLLLLDHLTHVRTGEVYLHFRNVLKKWGDGLLGIKLGRVDIPFGEEYLWNDSSDNLMVSHSAAFPWLWDEGIVLYGNMRGLGWVASVTDGSMGRSIEDHPAKAYTAKIYGSPWSPLYLSASAMKNGKTSMSAIYIGGVCFMPVGMGTGPRGFSSLGASPSAMVDATLLEAMTRISFSKHVNLELTLGHARIDDEVDAFDRNLTWFSIQPKLEVSSAVYLAARVSEIGTYDSQLGYMIGGEFMAGGKDAFGYDAKRLQRAAVALGWHANPRATVKFEVGRDRFEVIDASPFEPEKDKRTYFGAEVVLHFQ